MNTSQLHRAMMSEPLCRDNFIGVFASDKLPKTVKTYPACMIANVDDSKQPGSHWVAFFFDQEGQGQFFDSYGHSPQHYTTKFNDLLNKNSNSWTFNRKKVQSDFTTVCGQYCLYYVLFRCKGGRLTEMLDLFGEDTYLNDITVNEFVKERFMLNTRVVDDDFLISQICKALIS